MLPYIIINSAEEVSTKPELRGLDSSQIEPASILGGGLSNTPNLPIDTDCYTEGGALLEQ